MSPRLALVLAMGALACAPAVPPLPSPPHGVQRLTVSQPLNRTGQALVVLDPGLLERTLLGEDRVTVPDALGGYLRTLLEDRGFGVASTPTDASPDLRTEIDRWHLYSADYSSVTVDLTASLVNPDDGRELWKVQRINWVIPTPHARSGQESSDTASLTIARALIEGWQPAGAPGAGTP